MAKLLIGTKRRKTGELLRELLEEQGFRVSESCSSSKLDESSDLIIVDEWFLNKKLESLRAIRWKKSHIFLPVLLLTKAQNKKLINQYLRNSIVDDLLKIPVEKAVLLARISNLLQRKQITEELEAQRLELSAIYEKSPMLLLLVNSEHRVKKVNKYATEFIGAKKEGMVGKRPGAALHCLTAIKKPEEAGDSPECRECRLHSAVVSTLKRGKGYKHEEITLELLKYGEETQATFLLSTAYISFGKGPLVLVGLLNITQRKQLEEQYKHLSFHDQLTGLYNRAFAEEEMDRLDVDRQLPLGIIMCDLNGLKLVNDSFGHECGDELLQKTAEILRQSCRKEDIVARWGGDEFVIFLPKTKTEEVKIICNRIKKRCSYSQEKNIPVSIALGYASKASPNQDIKEVLGQAEEWMYKNKLTASRSSKGLLLNSLLKTLETKSHETEKHACRLHQLALALGEEIGLPTSELDRLSLLVTLHDIGKVSISEEVLKKPGKLTSEEWEIMKKHPERGYRMAAATPEFSHVAKEILCHHERWDGSGYPEGLKGEEIPLLSRITAVVDAYDAMTNHRSHSAPMPQKEAIAELKQCAGGQFDPKLVDVFLNILKKG